VRPGEIATFEALLKDLKAAREKASLPLTVLVSQAVAGQDGNGLLGHHLAELACRI
jgi:hypothetical protein